MKDGSGARRRELRGGSVEPHSRPSERAPQVAVIGSGRLDAGSELWGLAEEVGRRLAAAGATVVCGGRGGVMEAVARGAAGAGGEVIGVVPGDSTAEANPHCTHVVATGVGQARNLAVVSSGEVVIAVGGEWGTLSEIGLARAIGRPVVALRSWTLRGYELNSARSLLRTSYRQQEVGNAVVLTTPDEARARAGPARRRRATRQAGWSSGGFRCARRRARAAPPPGWRRGAGRQAG